MSLEKAVNTSIDSYKQSSYEKFKFYERFQFIRELMEKNNMGSVKSFLDVGCAKGEFIWYLKDYFPQTSFTGIDISNELLTLAKDEKKLKDVNFFEADAYNFDLDQIFDVVLMSGVLSIFDEYQSPLEAMIKHLKSGGTGYLFGMFNSYDIDVRLRFRNNAMKKTIWESGLNNFSLKGIKEFLLRFCHNIEINEFHLSMDLMPQENPVTSLTLNTKERGRIISNGTGMITDFYLIKFVKN